MHIRPYSEKDKERFRYICLHTAGCLDKPRKEQQFILKLYCDYYIENEAENCFALADENDEAVGYILCSEDFETYKKDFKPYLADIRKIGLRKFFYARGEIIAHTIASEKYKAHMHIDILPEYQSNGFGSEMIGTLRNHLKEKNIGGLMLVVGSGNTGAVRFYKKNGFVPFFDFEKGILMTLDI